MGVSKRNLILVSKSFKNEVGVFKNHFSFRFDGYSISKVGYCFIVVPSTYPTNPFLHSMFSCCGKIHTAIGGCLCPKTYLGYLYVARCGQPPLPTFHTFHTTGVCLRTTCDTVSTLNHIHAWRRKHDPCHNVLIYVLHNTPRVWYSHIPVVCIA